MRITQEADYALRICLALSQAEHPVGAPHLSERLCIPHSFTSKILRELMLANLVRSTRGVNGGFSLSVMADQLSLKQVIEAVDGPIAIRHCLMGDHNCSYQPDKSKCRFHRVFEELNSIITSRLELITIADMADVNVPIDELIEKLNKF